MHKTLRCLRPGDRVAAVAPAGPPNPERVAKVEALFERFGLTVHFYPSCHARHPQHDFLAGDDTLRLADLHAAFADPANAAVFCLRGGWGTARLLRDFDTALLRANPKPFVGYSDITALHALMVREGLPCFHAPMPASDLVVDGAEDDAEALFTLLMQPLAVGHVFAPTLLPFHWRVPGQATGTLVGGNLSIVASLLGTPWALPVEGAILFLEDVSEALYRVDRLLTQLRNAGVLDAVNAVVLGSFSEDEDPAAVLHEHLSALGKPVLAGWPAGHGRPNRALPLGVRVALDAAAGSITLQTPVLS